MIHVMLLGARKIAGNITFTCDAPLMPKKMSKHPLRQTREALEPDYRITQQDLADMVGCTRETINRIESDRLKLSAELAQKVDAVIGSDLETWVVACQSSDEFKVTDEKLKERFAKLRSFEQDARTWGSGHFCPSILLYRQISDILERELSMEDFEYLSMMSWKQGVESFNRVNNELKYKVDNVNQSAALTSALANACTQDSVFLKEVEALAEMIIAAKDAKKLSAVKWSFLQWAIKTTKEFDLPLDSLTSCIRGKDGDDRIQSPLENLLHENLSYRNQILDEIPDDALWDLESMTFRGGKPIQ